jgi:Protein of unknown function (DUF3239)
MCALMRTFDSSTSAAIPGALSVSRRRYANYFGKNAVDRWLYLACSHLPWLARGVPSLGPKVWQWAQTGEHLQHGCLNPAVVVDAATGLIAVFTSLTAVGDKPTPVVRILRERLDLIDKKPVRNGDRFAAASVYLRTPESWAEGRWSQFVPIVVDCLVDDRGCCENALARLKPLAWECLELALQQLGGLRKPGLYHVAVPDEMVRNAY